MSNKSLVDFNQRGLIPGPSESTDAFFARCARSTPTSSPPHQLWGMTPDWIEVLYRKGGLHFWEGGCTWIEEDKVSFQLHPAFLKKRKHWGYSREEIITHECVHVIRGAFEEPIFEEILAYQTSSSLFRRYWGPLWRTTHETSITLITLLICSIASFYQPLSWIAWSCSTLLLLCFSLRLMRAQRTFKRALKKLKGLFNKHEALAVMLHLTDQEIIHFSDMDHDEIIAYSNEMAKKQLRWQQIRAAYL